jgi:hypothetical protein
MGAGPPHRDDRGNGAGAAGGRDGGEGEVVIITIQCFVYLSSCSHISARRSCVAS